MDLEADSATFLALTEPEQTAWRTWNSELRKAFIDVQPITPDIPGYAEVIVAFSFAKALFRAGYLDAFVDGTPPTWDNTAPPLQGKAVLSIRGKMPPPGNDEPPKKTAKK